MNVSTLFTSGSSSRYAPRISAGAFVLLLCMIAFRPLHAQVAYNYTFSQTSGTYTPITGGTSLYSGTFDDGTSGPQTIPSFTFDGVTYTSMYVNTNGWLNLGVDPATTTNYTPLSSTTPGRCLSPFGRDLHQASSGTPSVTWTVVGSEIVVQWQDVRRYSTSTSVTEQFSFQARMDTATGIVRFVYDAVHGVSTVSAYPQVGLRGLDNTLATNVNIRSLAIGNPWTATTAGTSNSAAVAFDSATGTLPAAGLTFVYTPLPCINLSALTASNVTTGGATINWAVPSTLPLSYIYEVVAANGTADSTPILTGTAAGTDSNFTISTLADATTYHVYVKKVCSATDTSHWSPAATFTTLCLPATTYPYLQSFSSSLPPCWTVSHGATSDPNWAVTTSDATHGVAGPEAGSNFLYLDVYNAHTAGNPYKVTTAPFILTGAAKQVSYYYFLGTSGSSTPLTVNISTDGGNTWTALYSHTTSNSTFGTSSSTSFWRSNTIDLTTYMGDTVQFQFSATSNWGSGVCNMAIDEFLINNAPTCYPVSGLATTTVGGNNATFTWNVPAHGAPNDYNWQIRTSGIPDSTATGIVATGNTAGTVDSTTALAPLTTYQLWVQSDCGGVLGNSTWTGPLSFTTTTLPCSGAPTAGSASLVSAGVCSAIVTLTGSSYGYTGLTYQWQERYPAGSGTFTNVPGANISDTITLPGAVTDFRCVVTCTASGVADTSAIVTVTASPGEAAGFSPLAVTGFNQDVIANGNNNHSANPPSLTTTTWVDAPNGYDFYDASYSYNGTTYPATSLPVNGQVVSNSITGLLYQLQSATTSNVLQLRGGTQLTGTLTAVTPQSGTEVYLLGVSGNGASTITAVVHFTDGSSQTFTNLAVKDWFNGTPYSQGGFGRVGSGGFDGGAPGGNNPRMYDIPLPLAPANYAKLVQSITITNTGNSVAPNNQIVNIFAVTIATPTPASFCGGLATSVSLFNAAASGVTYQWQSSTTSGGPYTDVSTGTGATSTTYTNTSTGSIYYVVEATCTASGLTATSNEVNVNINPAVNVTVTPATVNFCSNDTGVVLTAHTTGANITYAWSPTAGLGSTTDSAVVASPTSTTTYTVTAVNTGGCTSTASAVVNYVVAPPVTSIASMPSELCAGATAVLNVVADTTGQPALTYTWSPSGTLSRTDTSTVVASPPAGTTTYSVTVSNGTCSTTASVTDTVGATLTIAPTATTTATGTLCARQTTFRLAANRTGGGGPFTYSWTSSPAGFTSSASDTTVVPDTTTTYYIDVTDNCGSMLHDSVTVTVVPTPYVSVSPAAIIYCAGSTPLALSATGAASFSWSPSAGLSATTGDTVYASPTVSTNYVVTGTTGGCSATATAVVTLAQPPSISLVTATPSAPSICQGYRSQLDVVASTPVGPYCVPTVSNTFLHYLGSFYLTDTTNTTTYVSTSRNFSAGTTNNYVDHGTAATTGSLAADSAYNFNGSFSGIYEGLAIWIDFNQNGIFDNSELLYAHYANNSTSGVPYSGRFTIPSTALSGVTKMRVRLGWGSDTIPDANGLYSCSPGNTDGFSTYGSTDDYTVTITGGATPSGLDYAWSPSGTLDSATIHNPVATPSATTGYTVTVTDPNTGCSATMTDTVYVNAPTPLTATISGPTGTVCGAMPYTLTTAAAGGCTPYAYAWSEGTGTLTASLDSILPTATTTYTVTVTDSSGNQATATFTLNVSNPLVTATTGASLCGSGTATLVATPSAGATIVWYDSLTNGTLQYSGDTFVTPTLSADMTYYAFATTTSPACSSAGTAVVAAVHSNPALTLNYSIVHVCATGEQLAITSTLPAHSSYVWSPVTGLYTDTTAATPYTGGNAATVYGMPGATTTYTVTLYDSTTGCSSHQTDSFIVYQRPTATLSGTDTSVCPGAVLNGTITFTGTGPWTFIRTTDHGAPVSATATTSPYAYSDTPVVSGPIKITVLTDQHCIAKYSDLDSFNVTVVPGSAAFTASLSTVHLGDSVTFTSTSTGAVSYAWNFGDGTTSTAQNPSHTYGALGIYTVSLTVTNSLGCTSTITHQDTVIPPLAISDISSDNSMLKIFSYENKVMVDFSQYKSVQATIRIYNVIGQELSNETHNAPTTYVKAVPGAEIAYVIVSVKMSDGSIVSKKVLITN